jgi:hypothetical protein
MIRKMRVWLSAFMLMVFLFPGTVQAVHLCIHQHYDLCNEHSEQHLHQSQPDCRLCDFTFSQSVLSANLWIPDPDFFQIEVNSPILFQSVETLTVDCLQLRGPPVHQV